MIQYALLTSPAEGGLNNRLQKGYASLVVGRYGRELTTTI